MSDQAVTADNSPAPDTAANTPVQGKDRIAALDILRGVALLGILIMNIIVFGQPFAALSDPSLFGTPDAATYWSWFVTALFFEGTFRTIFGMLFGAGIYLFFSRLEERVDKGRARSLHLRRTFWLILFGALDAWLLLWVGDILFLYGLMGLLLWLFRNLETRGLLIWIFVFAAISLGMKFLGGMGTEFQIAAITEHDAKIAAGETVSQEDTAMIESMRQQIEFTHPSPERRDREVSLISSGYWGATEVYYPAIQWINTLGLVFFMLWDSFITMLLGLLLFKRGVIKGKSSVRTYALMAVIGYSIAIPLRGMHLLDYAAANYDLVLYTWNQVWYDLERVMMALGHIGLIMLAIKAGAMPLAARLAAVGRMALTNYLVHSVIGLVVFILLGFYGAFSRIELNLIMLAIWALQLWYSPLWLARYRFGPAEWLWRTLTYWRWQPMAQ